MPSPSSSKRSRSRDSSWSAATAPTSLNTPFITPSATPSASAPSLIIPQSNSQAPSLLESQVTDPTPYPAFLRLSRSEICDKFQDLEFQQRDRIVPAWKPHHAQQQGPPPPQDPKASQWAKCTGVEVQNRNRYMNVEPWLNNRVKLQVPDGCNDYINASPIVLESTKSKTVTRFIATQGPKQESYSHIWRMIWHETTSPAVTIMLTKTHESGREKCFPYYPRTMHSPVLKLNPHDEFADSFSHTLTLTSLTDDESVAAQVRELDMTAIPTTPSEDESASSTPETKKIWHFLFEGWPDFSVPEDANQAALLNLIALSRKKNANLENPRIVHCSAGVGRSGTFIALDWLLCELEEGSLDDIDNNSSQPTPRNIYLHPSSAISPTDDDNEEDDYYDPIYAIVSNLREQRMMMVQSESQYLFLYDVMRQQWQSRWIKLHPKEAESLGLYINTHHDNDGETRSNKKPRQSQDDDDDDSDYPPRHHHRSSDSDNDNDSDEEDDAVLHSQILSQSQSLPSKAELEAELAGNQMEFEHGKT